MLENKKCTICKSDKPVADFGFLNKSKNQLKSQCIECDKKRQNAYYKKNRDLLLQYKSEEYKTNKEKYLLRSKTYRANNPEKTKVSHQNWLDKNPDAMRINSKIRKSRIRAATKFVVTKKDVAKILSKPCIYCGSKENIQLEHVIPVSRGGVHSVGNLAPACGHCNNQKNKWFVTEWKMLQKKWGVSF